MPEQFEIAIPWILWLLPLPLLVYFLLPALRMKSASIVYPNFSKAEMYIGRTARSSALVRRRNIVSWIFMMLIWAGLLAALSTPRLVGEPELKVKTSRNFLIVADISFSMATKD